MNLSEYRQACLRTAGDISPKIVHLGLCGEAGEIADLVKKHLGHGHPLDEDKLAEELGDFFWYAAIACEGGHDVDFADCWAAGDLAYLTLCLCEHAVYKETHYAIDYVAGLAQHIGLTLDEIAERNIEKLQRRYPDGFSTERSLNRESEGAL